MGPVSQSQGIIITPFWNRIPHFFLYGLNPLPLAFSMGLGLGSYLLSAWWSYLILYAIAIKYSMACLQFTVRGDVKPPGLTSEVLLDKYELPLMLFFAVVLYTSMLGSIIGSIGFLAGIAFYSLGIILFPAIIICLGLSEQLLFSINPLNLIGLVRAIGWPYLALFGLLFFLGIAQSTFESIFLPNVTSEVASAIWLTINTVFSIISFHMMGYVAMQYHEAIGEPEPEILKSTQATSDHDGLDLLQQFINEGNTAAATEELRCLIKSQPNNLDLRRRLHNYTLVTNQPDIMRRNAANLMRVAVEQGKPNIAAQVFSECRERKQLCHPKMAACYLPVLKALRSQGKLKDAVAFAKDFHARYPGNEHVPFVYLELAKIFSEEMQRDDLAQRLLRFTLASYKTHALSADVQKYLDVVEQFHQSV